MASGNSWDLDADGIWRCAGWTQGQWEEYYSTYRTGTAAGAGYNPATYNSGWYGGYGGRSSSNQQQYTYQYDRDGNPIRPRDDSDDDVQFVSEALPPRNVFPSAKAMPPNPGHTPASPILGTGAGGDGRGVVFTASQRDQLAQLDGRDRQRLSFEFGREQSRKIWLRNREIKIKPENDGIAQQLHISLTTESHNVYVSSYEAQWGFETKIAQLGSVLERKNFRAAYFRKYNTRAFVKSLLMQLVDVEESKKRRRFCLKKCAYPWDGRPETETPISCDDAETYKRAAPVLSEPVELAHCDIFSELVTGAGAINKGHFLSSRWGNLGATELDGFWRDLFDDLVDPSTGRILFPDVKKKGDCMDAGEMLSGAFGHLYHYAKTSDPPLDPEVVERYKRAHLYMRPPLYQRDTCVGGVAPGLTGDLSPMSRTRFLQYYLTPGAVTGQWVDQSVQLSQIELRPHHFARWHIPTTSSQSTLCLLKLLRQTFPILGTQSGQDTTLNLYSKFLHRAYVLQGPRGHESFTPGLNMHIVYIHENDGAIFLHNLEADQEPNFLHISPHGDVTSEFLEAKSASAAAELRQYGSTAVDRHVRKYMKNRLENLSKQIAVARKWCLDPAREHDPSVNYKRARWLTPSMDDFRDDQDWGNANPRFPKAKLLEYNPEVTENGVFLPLALVDQVRVGIYSSTGYRGAEMQQQYGRFQDTHGGLSGRVEYARSRYGTAATDPLEHVDGGATRRAEERHEAEVRASINPPADFRPLGSTDPTQTSLYQSMFGSTQVNAHHYVDQHNVLQSNQIYARLFAPGYTQPLHDVETERLYESQRKPFRDMYGWPRAAMGSRPNRGALYQYAGFDGSSGK